MSEEIEMLTALLRNFQGAINSPQIARALLYKRESFADDLVREAATELWLNDGDWTRTRAALSRPHAPRRERFFAWAEKVITGGAA